MAQARLPNVTGIRAKMTLLRVAIRRLPGLATDAEAGQLSQKPSRRLGINDFASTIRANPISADGAPCFYTRCESAELKGAEMGAFDT